MIVYFADRQMRILGSASTHLPDGIRVAEDMRTEEIETGVATFECRVLFSAENRLKIEDMCEAGNYILRNDGDTNEFYTIIDEEIDTKDQSVLIYAEDAGLDLLNEVYGEYEATEAHDFEWYVNRYSKDSGFEIGTNEVPSSAARKLSWDGEQTATERLASIATQFGGYELSFSFDIQGMEITHKYINFYQERGKNIEAQLRLNQDIDRIVTKKSVANLATSLYCTGGTPKGKNKPITLDGYSYDDGDFYVSGKYLRSRNAVAKWSRYQWEKNTTPGYVGHIVKRYSYDTTSQETLCKHALTELKKLCEMEVNYEVDINKLPENVCIGDRINIVDDAGELYLSARVLKLETSICDQIQTATLGEYLIKDSGISQRVEELASQFAVLSQNRVMYTWVAYADDESGTGITLNPTGKPYLGVAANQFTDTPDLSNPSVYTWSRVEGPEGPVGATGSPGPIGEPGQDGRGLQSVIQEYYLSLSSVEQTGGEWSETEPAWEYHKYIWVRNRVTWSDNTTDYTTPILASALNSANETAHSAIQKVEQKRVYYTDTAPDGTILDGTIWFDTQNGGIYTWVDGAWSAHKVGTISVLDGSITADKIKVEELFAREITAYHMTLEAGCKIKGVLEGATGTFSGVLSAQDIDITSSYSSEDALGNFVNTIKTPTDALGYKYIELKSSASGARGYSAAYIKPTGITLVGNVSIESDGYQVGNLEVSGGVTIADTLAVKKMFLEPISSVSDDAPANWAAQGNSVNWYQTAGLLNNQPSKYGYLLNISGAGHDIRQIWTEQGAGSLYHRSGNGSGWANSGAWFKIADSSNIGSLIPTGAPGTKGGAQFASGGINVGSVAAGGYKDYSHIFSGTFGGTPNVVVCTYESSAGTSASGNVARKVVLTKRSATGFTVRLYNNSSSAWNPYVEYIAIYKG